MLGAAILILIFIGAFAGVLASADREARAPRLGDAPPRKYPTINYRPDPVATAGPRRATAPLEVRDPGDVLFEVVGQKHYLAALTTLLNGLPDLGLDDDRRARLVPETDNPHDANAVRVEVGGQTIGYLARSDAKQFRGALRAALLAPTYVECFVEIEVAGADFEVTAWCGPNSVLTSLKSVSP